ncbi:MAG: hypothetical protein MZU95_16155 [Desulfomicrobium escambiense]|nr:hypothetical protein [Desulfomicrobium escambiense]
MCWPAAGTLSEAPLPRRGGRSSGSNTRSAAHVWPGAFPRGSATQAGPRRESLAGRTRAAGRLGRPATAGGRVSGGAADAGASGGVGGL